MRARRCHSRSFAFIRGFSNTPGSRVLNRSFFPSPLSLLDIDLSAVARNWLFLKKKLKAGADCAAVVKADAYGLGAVEIAKALYDQGCRHFFVAHIEEALALATALTAVTPAQAGVHRHPGTMDSRLRGNDLSIYLLNGPQGDIAGHDFIPVLNSPGDIEYWLSLAPERPCVLHIDTGMNRLGLSAREVGGRQDLIKRLNLRYVMSHLACSEDPKHPKNEEQRRLFETLTAGLGRPLRLSFANSGGIFLGADYHFDLVRPGCALYGINPTLSTNPMQPVVTLKAKIIQVREIESAGAVGYGATYHIAPPAKTATISVGYADGYLRSLTGKGKVFINGVSCPVIGRVSMDLIVADVSDVRDFGDGYAEIIGAHQDVDAVARQAGTIGYEILTGLGARYKRTYGS